MMTFEFRLSNEISFAVEFTAANENEFRKNLWRSFMEFARENAGTARLHVKTTVDREWLSPNYPKNNNPVILAISPDKAKSKKLWRLALNAITAGDYLEHGLKTTIRELIDTGREVDLYVIDGGKK